MPTGFPDYYGGLTLPVTVQQGGTGHTSITTNALLLGNGTGAMVETNVGTANQVLQIPSGGGAPAFQTISLSASGLTGILPIASGGTATATPALVAGSSIVITGSWPNNTIALSSSPTAATLVLTPTSSGTGLQLSGHTAGPITVFVSFFDANASAFRGYLGLSEGANAIITGDAAGDICLNAATGNLILGSNASKALTIDQSQVCTLAHPLAIASGGTGAGAFITAGIPQIVATVDQTAQTATIGSTTLYAVPANKAGLYEISIYLETTTAGTGGTVSASITNVTESGTSSTKTTANVNLNGQGANLGTAAGSSPVVIFSQASQNITYATTVTAATGNPQYSVRFRVKYLG